MPRGNGRVNHTPAEWADALRKGKLLLNAVNTAVNRAGGGEGCAGMYGTPRPKTLELVFAKFYHTGSLNRFSRLLDPGSGCNRPLIYFVVVAYFLGIQFETAPVGIEFDENKVEKARGALIGAKRWMVAKGHCSAEDVESIKWPRTVKASIFEPGAIEQHRPTHVYSFCRGICNGRLPGCCHILECCMRSRALQHRSPGPGQPNGRARCVTVVLMDEGRQRSGLRSVQERLNAQSCVTVKLHDRCIAAPSDYTPFTGSSSGSGEGSTVYVCTGRIKPAPKADPELAPCSGVGCPLCAGHA